tara:strand:- start:99 stop:512 length:414 start_codon:yes stop_codon:yes gene_type:complete
MPNIDLTQIITADDKVALVQARRRDALHAHRDQLIAAGTTVTVTGIGDVPVIGTPFDQNVMLSLIQRGSARLAAGDATADLVFRDANNTIHQLTGAQAVELAEAGMMWVELVMSASWAIKDAGPIPEDFTDPSYWPS